MKIGIAGPMTLRLLDLDIKNGCNIPIGYDSPAISVLINALLKCGHSVVAYTTSIGIARPIVYEGEKLTVCIGRRRERHVARDLFKEERKELVHLMRTYPADIINAQWSYEFAWAALESGLPTLVTVRDNALRVLKYRTDPYRFMRTMINYLILNRARFLSTNSQYLFNVLSEKNKKKTRVIPNFYPEWLEEVSSLPVEKSDYLISVSNGFGKLKNIMAAMKAFSIIKRNYLDIRYCVVGDDMEKGGRVYKHALRNRLADGVTFEGMVPYDRVIDLVRKAMLFVHPSREESFGMSVLESMVVGTAVIGGDHSGNIPFMLNHGQCGVLCDINSPQDIARSALKILLDKGFAETLIGNAQRFAKEDFSEKVGVKRYVDYYSTITNQVG